MTGECKDCKFFTDGDDKGFCWRYPPIRNEAFDFFSSRGFEQPMVAPDCGCGEFQQEQGE